MKILSVEFVTSVIDKKSFPKLNLPEIGFVGRSNVGKSSLINSITNRKQLAKVSSTPGKTRLLNYFIINNKFYLVDMPGYGYDAKGGTQRHIWDKLIADYLMNKETLKGVVFLLDCRRMPSELDIDLVNFLIEYRRNIIFVLTKTDKLSKNQLIKQEANIKNTLKLSFDFDFIYFSVLAKKGKQELLSALDEILNL